MENFQRLVPRNVREATEYYCSVVRRYCAVDSSTERLMQTLEVLAHAIERLRSKRGCDVEIEILAQEWVLLVCYLLDKAK